MKNRRTYASLDGNLQCRYSVNGAIMGSTLDRPKVFSFEISISDPDTASQGQDYQDRHREGWRRGGADVQPDPPTPSRGVPDRGFHQQVLLRAGLERRWGRRAQSRSDPARRLACPSLDRPECGVRAGAAKKGFSSLRIAGSSGWCARSETPRRARRMPPLRSVRAGAFT